MPKVVVRGRLGCEGPLQHVQASIQLTGHQQEISLEGHMAGPGSRRQLRRTQPRWACRRPARTRPPGPPQGPPPAHSPRAWGSPGGRGIRPGAPATGPLPGWARTCGAAAALSEQARQRQHGRGARGVVGHPHLAIDQGNVAGIGPQGGCPAQHLQGQRINATTLPVRQFLNGQQKPAAGTEEGRI